MESIVCLIIGIVYLLLPTSILINTFHKEEYLLEEKTYSQMKSQFVTTYRMMHPIYSLKKIFVEKELERLNLYQIADEDNSHHLKVSSGID